MKPAGRLDAFSEGEEIEVLATFPNAVLPLGTKGLIHDLSGFHILLC